MSAVRWVERWLVIAVLAMAANEGFDFLRRAAGLPQRVPDVIIVKKLLPWDHYAIL